MLTDYHLHLRPDGPDTPSSRYFTTTNVDRFREAAADRGVAELGVSEHIYRFVQALDVWDHEYWRDSAFDDIDAYCAFVREETDLKLGVEADYIPGREDRMANLLDGRPWDYVVGSVHFLGDDAVDYDKYDVWTRADNADKVWRRYFEVLGEAAASGMYDVMAHPDLVKVWGQTRPWPDRDLRYYYEIAMEGILEGGAAFELSTAGLRKPVGEIYPSLAFLEMLVDAGVPVALSSDAHVPEHVAHGYDQAQELLAQVGVTELCVFSGRERTLVEIGPT